MTAVEAVLRCGTFARGVHPEEAKGLAAEAAIEVLPPPAQTALPLLQHTGAPAEPVVKPRQAVALGELVAQAKGFVSAALHASLAGVVLPLGVTTLPNGRRVKTLPLRAEGEQLAGRALFEEIFGGEWPVGEVEQTPEQILQAVQAAGIVGLGGAAFPTHVKLTRNPKKPVDTLVLNGCECEPFLTADYRVMVEAPRPVVAGALLAARAAGAREILIVVEDNKPRAIAALEKAAAGTPVRLRVAPTKYPMGGERQLLVAALGRAVPTGGLPLDVGAAVINVGTAAALARAVLRGKPLTHRVVTVSGPGIAQPKNILAPLGVSYAELVKFCGGLKAGAARAIAGGPMMGFALAQLDVPVTKGTSGLTILTEAEVQRQGETNCLRCGRCVDVCPLHLVPAKLAAASRHRDWELARRYHLTACCECGCCAYSCPAGIPLAQLIRTGKALLPR